MDITIDIGNLCTHCGRDTAFESGADEVLFVNRIPSDADGKLLLSGGDDVPIDVMIRGYMCVECQSMPCDRCGENTHEYEHLDEELVCEGCLSKQTISNYVVKRFDEIARSKKGIISLIDMWNVEQEIEKDFGLSDIESQQIVAEVIAGKRKQNALIYITK